MNYEQLFRQCFVSHINHSTRWRTIEIVLQMKEEKNMKTLRVLYRHLPLAKKCFNKIYCTLSETYISIEKVKDCNEAKMLQTLQ